MTDTMKAYSIIDDVWPIREYGRSRVIALAFDAIKAVENALPKQVLRDRKRQWTERRMRSIVDQEAPRIDAYEMSDLQQMRLNEARREQRKLRQRLARLETALAVRDEAFHGGDIAAVREQIRGVGGVDRAGTD